MHVSLLIKLLLDIHGIGLAVKHTVELFLCLFDVTVKTGLEFVQLGNDIALAIV